MKWPITVNKDYSSSSASRRFHHQVRHCSCLWNDSKSKMISLIFFFSFLALLLWVTNCLSTQPSRWIIKGHFEGWSSHFLVYIFLEGNLKKTNQKFKMNAAFNSLQKAPMNFWSFHGMESSLCLFSCYLITQMKKKKQKFPFFVVGSFWLGVGSPDSLIQQFSRCGFFLCFRSGRSKKKLRRNPMPRSYRYKKKVIILFEVLNLFLCNATLCVCNHHLSLLYSF